MYQDIHVVSTTGIKNLMSMLPTSIRNKLHKEDMLTYKINRQTRDVKFNGLEQNLQNF